ncbi:MAG: beta-ketoacyl synthase N-terminal-like domain-containing protein, partial [Myxococcota bacterium]
MRIAITGVGVWSAAGTGPAAILDRLDAGAPALSGEPPYPVAGLTNPRAGIVAGLDRIRPAEALLQRVVADALADAALAPSPDPVALVVGTASGGRCGPWERWHRAILDGGTGDPRGIGRDDPTRAVADALGLRGRAATLSVACASGTAALAVGAGWIDDGAPVVVAAGVDALSLFVHAGFAGLGALSATVPHPFRADRDGLVLGEGAGALVLERWDHAVARGAEILAELVGTGLSCDARHMTAPHREGRGVAQAIREALGEAAVAPAAVGLVSVHGTGTRFNDAMEAHALHTVFGPDPRPGGGPHVYGVKAVIGHLLGAAGAVECAIAVHALASGRRPRPIADVDPELPWGFREGPGEPPAVAVVTSSAFGGINAAAVLRRPGSSAEPVPADPAGSRQDPDAPAGVTRGPLVEVALPPGTLLATVWSDAPPRASRLERYTQVGLWAIGAALAAAGGATPGGDDTGVVLEEGPAVIYDGDVYAGESMVPYSARKAKVRLGFAKDLSVHCTGRAQSRTVFTSVQIVRGVLVEEFREETDHVFRVESDHQEPVDVVIEMPRDHTRTLNTAFAMPFEETEGFHRFKITAPPGGMGEITVQARWQRQARVQWQQVD